MNASARDLLTAPFAAALQRALDASPRARELCSVLAGKRLQLTVTGLPASFTVTALPETLQFTRGAAPDAPPADVTVSGSPVALLALASGDAGATLNRGGLHIGGDEQLAARFQELAQLLRPDLEAIAGRFIGRIPAHLATGAASAALGWGRAAGASLLRNAADYLAHESRDLVPRAEGESYLSGVEALRAQVGAAEARAAELAARLERLLARSRS